MEGQKRSAGIPSGAAPIFKEKTAQFIGEQEIACLDSEAPRLVDIMRIWHHDLVDYSKEPRPGHIAIALINSEAVVKKYLRQKSRVILRSTYVYLLKTIPQRRFKVPRFGRVGIKASGIAKKIQTVSIDPPFVLKLFD